MRQVSVNLAGSAYAVLIKPGLLAEAGAELRKLTGSARAFAVTDTSVAPHYLKPVLQGLAAAGFEAASHVIPAGETHKTLEEISRIYDMLIGNRIDRQSPVLALGGGVVGDMTGFAAATVLRGVPFVQVPTTLLSMVDASVGGKTGVDHPRGKNLIGAFHQPIAVLIDPRTLTTLPHRELALGLAECIKHEIIRDADGFAKLEQSIDLALGLDLDYLSDLIAHNVAIKARVVEADPFEHGERAHLNFGHTFGHAIEAVSGYAYSHGESVALGMVAASRLAQGLGMLDAESVERIVRLIARAGLPTGQVKLDPSAVVDAMLYDKKVRAGSIRFILPERIGHVSIRAGLPAERVLAAVESLGA